MSTGNIIDIVLAVLLLLCAVVGAKRGLFKSIMSFAVVIVALLGAAFLSAALSKPVANAVYPKIETKLNAYVQEYVSAELESALQASLDASAASDVDSIDNSTVEAPSAVDGAPPADSDVTVFDGTEDAGFDLSEIDLSKFGLKNIDLSGLDLSKLDLKKLVPEDIDWKNFSFSDFNLDAVLSDIAPDGDALAPFSDILDRFDIDGAEVSREAQESDMSLQEVLLRALLTSIVRAVLFVLLFVLLWIVLKLIVGSLDHVFRLPILRQLNGLGGALLSIFEGSLLIYLVLWACTRFGVVWFEMHAEGTYLLRFFLSVNPVALVLSAVAMAKAK